MFEEEAKEYYDTTAPIISDITGLDFENGVKLAFKDGAEFGYNKAFVEADKNLKAVVADFNKANEWHYAKDGLPKESKKYYVYSEEWGVEIRKFIADAGCFECRKNIIIAWKEIVLPKEI